MLCIYLKKQTNRIQCAVTKQNSYQNKFKCAFKSPEDSESLMYLKLKSLLKLGSFYIYPFTIGVYFHSFSQTCLKGELAEKKEQNKKQQKICHHYHHQQKNPHFSKLSD